MFGFDRGGCDRWDRGKGFYVHISFVKRLNQLHRFKCGHALITITIRFGSLCKFLKKFVCALCSVSESWVLLRAIMICATGRTLMVCCEMAPVYKHGQILWVLIFPIEIWVYQQKICLPRHLTLKSIESHCQTSKLPKTWQSIQRKTSKNFGKEWWSS